MLCDNHSKTTECLTILSPLVLPANLLLFFWGEIIGDVEGLPDLLRRLALNHVCDGLATDIKKRLDVKIIGGLRQVRTRCAERRRTNELTRMISKSIS